MARVGDDREKVDLEPGRQLDSLEILADGIRILAGLRYHWDVEVGGRDLHLLELLEVLALGPRLADKGDEQRAGQRDGGDGFVELHVRLLSSRDDLLRVG